MALKSNEGAKQLIKRHIDEVFSIPFPDGAIDIDTPRDYEQLQTYCKDSGDERAPTSSGSV
jgi:molybdenum cofactor cytidylyltransferase